MPHQLRVPLLHIIELANKVCPLQGEIAMRSQLHALTGAEILAFKSSLVFQAHAMGKYGYNLHSLYIYKVTYTLKEYLVVSAWN